MQRCHQVLVNACQRHAITKTTTLLEKWQHEAFGYTKGRLTDLGEKYRSSPAESLVERMRQPYAVSIRNSTEAPPLKTQNRLLTAPKGCTKEVRGSVCQPEQPSVAHTVASDAELVLKEALSTVHDSLICEGWLIFQCSLFRLGRVRCEPAYPCLEPSHRGSRLRKC